MNLGEWRWIFNGDSQKLNMQKCRHRAWSREMPLRLQSDKPRGTGSLNPLDFTSFCLEPEMLDQELWDLVFSMLGFYRTWVRLFLSVLVSFPFAVILENLTKTTSGRKCFFWLTVQGYALSSRGNQGSRGLKQLGILHPPSRTKQWVLTRLAFCLQTDLDLCPLQLTEEFEGISKGYTHVDNPPQVGPEVCLMTDSRSSQAGN